MEKSPLTHGEGNPEAAQEFNEAEQKFVNSPRGKEKIREGAKVQPGEEAQLKQAEERGKSKARNDDSNTTKMRR